MPKNKKNIQKDLTEEKDQVVKIQEKEKEHQDTLKLNLTPEQKDELVERVCYLVEKDEGDRREFMDRRKHVRDMYEGKVEPKTDPWVNCANVKTQLTHMSVELLHSRLYPSAYNEDLIYWRPMEKSDIENIENISKFMSWVIRDMGMSAIVDDFTHNIILDGTGVLKIRWVKEYKWVQRKIPIENPTKDAIKKIIQVVYSFFGGKKKFEVEKKKYKIEYEYKPFETCKAEVVDIEDVGFPTYSVPSSREDELEYIWHRSYPTYSELKEMGTMGQVENVDNIGTYIDNLLVEGTKKSDIDAEGTKITQNKYNYKCQVIELYDKYDINGDGVREDIVITIEKNSKTFLDGRPLLAISRINERPFIIGQFIRRTNRMLGKGAGEIAVPFEEEANAIHNQRLDAGTMSIIPFGVYRAGSGFKPENIELSPGVWIPVDDVNDAKWITVANNTMISFQEERMLMDLMEKILSVGSYQSGQESDVNRSRSTARGTMAIIQQGETRFIILAKRIQEPLSRALNKILHQWQDKIPPGMGMRVLGEKGEDLFPDGIAPEDLAGNYDSYLITDSTGGSKATDRQMRGWIYQNFIMNPFLAQNPSGLWQLSADTLKSTGIYEDAEQLLGEKPIQSPNAHTVQEENIMMLEGRTVETSPQDNIVEHLVGHYGFRDSGDFMMMPPEYRVNFDRHLEETKQQLMGSFQKMQQQGMNQQPNPMLPQQPMGGMNESQSGNVGSPQGVEGVGTPNPANQGGNITPGQGPIP